ncbi:MAG: CoA transferase [Porticoccaceae bacterium]|nr:CoA transferase [Porticoccaceae bacterium]
MDHILKGYKVLDFTHFLAGPTTTRIMAEMGAEVIKVELYPAGDAVRQIAFLKNGRSGYYVQQNRGKKSLCIDVKKPQGLKVIKELLREVDVVTENFSVGAMARMGLGWEEIHKINPRIVMSSITAFGQSGPLSHLSGFDAIGQAYAGVTDMIGDPNGPPSFPMLGIGDVMTGVHALAAIGFALLHREKSGKGQYLDTTLLDSYFHCHEINVQIASCTKGAMVPTRSGSHHFALSPAGIFKGKKRFMFIAGLLHFWEGVAKAIDREDLITDPLYETNELRVANNDALVEIIEEWIQRQESDDAAIKILEDAKVPVAPILSVQEAMDHPHLIERRTVRTINDPVMGEFQIPGMPLRFSDFPDELPLEAVALGESNREILSSYLGYSSADVDGLYEADVIKTEGK